jgi:hypothetical protein
LLADIGAKASRSGEFVQKGEQDRAGARAEIENAQGCIPVVAGKHGIAPGTHNRFRIGARRERCGCHFEIERPEASVTDDAIHGFATQATRDEGIQFRAIVARLFQQPPRFDHGGIPGNREQSIGDDPLPRGCHKPSSARSEA